MKIVMNFYQLLCLISGTLDARSTQAFNVQRIIFFVLKANWRQSWAMVIAIEQHFSILKTLNIGGNRNKAILNLPICLSFMNCKFFLHTILQFHVKYILVVCKQNLTYDFFLCMKNLKIVIFLGSVIT